MNHVSVLMRSCLMTLAGVALAWCAGAEPRKLGDLYEIEILASALGPDGQLVEKPQTVTLSVLTAPDGTVSTATVEMVPRPGSVSWKVPRASLPAEVADKFLAEDSEIVFFPSPMGGGPGGRLTLDLAEPPPTPGDKRPPPPRKLKIVDATGRPAAGLKAVIQGSMYNPALNKDSTYLLSSQTLPSDGFLRIRWPRLVRPAGYPDFAAMNPNMTLPGNPRRLVVTDPASGQAETRMFPEWDYEAAKPGMRQTISLSLLAPGNADTTVPVFAGRVVGEDGKTPRQADISLTWLELPGMGGQGFNNMAGTISTAADGTFRFGIPTAVLEKATGQGLLPEAVRLRVTAGVPGGPTTTDSNGVTLKPGDKNVIQLGHVETITVRFVDAEGNPHPDFVKNARYDSNVFLTPRDPEINLGRGGQAVHLILRDFDEAQGTAKLAGVPAPRTYEAKWRDQRYLPQRVERGAAGAVITWRLDSAHATGTGRLVDAISGTPVEGGYVASSFEGNAGATLASMDATERDSIFARWMSGGAQAVTDEGGHIRLKKGNGMWFGVVALTRSGPDGRFRLELPPGKELQGICIYAPGYMPLVANLTPFGEAETRRSGEVILPDAVMVPVAEATVTVKPPLRIPDPFLKNPAGRPAERISVNTVVSFDPPATWKAQPPGLNPTKTNPWKREYTESWNALGSPYRVFVPAGIKFNVSAANANEPTLGVAFWKDQGPLERGSKADLGERELPVKRPFLIVVKRADGTPAAGTGVRIDGMLPLVTDERGEAIGWSTGYVERIEVMPKRGWEIAAKKEKITIPDSREPFRVDLVIPAGK